MNFADDYSLSFLQKMAGDDLVRELMRLGAKGWDEEDLRRNVRSFHPECPTDRSEIHRKATKMIAERDADDAESDEAVVDRGSSGDAKHPDQDVSAEELRVYAARLERKAVVPGRSYSTMLLLELFASVSLLRAEVRDLAERLPEPNTNPDTQP